MIAACSCGIDAEMFGSLMIFAAGVFVRSPRVASASGSFCASASFSGKLAMMRPASEMSEASTSMPVPLV